VFELIPAIDVAGGRVVRLMQGDPDRETVYGEDPVGTAQRWLDEGARALHLVDLDAAFGRGSLTGSLVARIANLGVPIQVGGGVRSPEAATRLLDAGASRVVLGSLLARRPVLEQVVALCGPERLMAAIDVGAGTLWVEGWTTAAALSAEGVAAMLQDLGMGRVVVTAVERDGTGRGADVELVREWVARGFAVISAGGIASPDDLRHLRAVGASGAVLGRALYDGRLTLREGMDALC
jgi:phosphoribosylformimino-5-aminoimidazole carboxamide ribotide isomerase